MDNIYNHQGSNVLEIIKEKINKLDEPTNDNIFQCVKKLNFFKQ